MGGSAYTIGRKIVCPVSNPRQAEDAEGQAYLESGLHVRAVDSVPAFAWRGERKTGPILLHFVSLAYMQVTPWS